MCLGGCEHRLWRCIPVPFLSKAFYWSHFFSLARSGGTLIKSASAESRDSGFSGLATSRGENQIPAVNASLDLCDGIPGQSLCTSCWSGDRRHVFPYSSYKAGGRAIAISSYNTETCLNKACKQGHRKSKFLQLCISPHLHPHTPVSTTESRLKADFMPDSPPPPLQCCT